MTITIADVARLCATIRPWIEVGKKKFVRQSLVQSFDSRSRNELSLKMCFVLRTKISAVSRENVHHAFVVLGTKDVYCTYLFLLAFLNS